MNSITPRSNSGGGGEEFCHRQPQTQRGLLLFNLILIKLNSESAALPDDESAWISARYLVWLTVVQLSAKFGQNRKNDSSAWAHFIPNKSI